MISTLNFILNLTLLHLNKDICKKFTFNSIVYVFQFQTKPHRALQLKIESNIKVFLPIQHLSISSRMVEFIWTISFDLCNISTCSLFTRSSNSYICFKYQSLVGLKKFITFYISFSFIVSYIHHIIFFTFLFHLANSFVPLVTLTHLHPHPSHLIS